jgi:hypothetical protein
MHDMFKLYEEQIKLDFDLDSKLALASTPSAHGQIRAAFTQFRASKFRGKTMADIAKMPFALKPRAATVDTDHEPIQDGVPQPRPASSLADIVKQLEDGLQKLKEWNPDVTSEDADADAGEAKACVARGDSAGALRHYDTAIFKLGAAIVSKKKTSALRAEPSSRSRAHRLTASGFSGMPSVAALNSALGRGGALSIADRASLALAPVARRIPAPPAISTPAAPSGSRERILAIKSEREAINSEYRKTGIYTPAAQARDAKLNCELKAELRNFNVR